MIKLVNGAIKKALITILFFILLTPNIFGQSIIINEVSQGGTGNQEYVEFLVIGPDLVNCDDTPPCIDLRLWVFDDNNGNLNTGGPQAGVGIAAGACRFANDPFWACIPAGTLIVIYNDSDPNPALPANDLNMSDGNCALVVPISSNLFEKHTTLPTSADNTYATTGWVSGGGWTQISMANGGDGFQIYDPANLTTPVHSVGWDEDDLAQIYFTNTSMTASVCYATDCNYFSQASWTVGSTGTDQTPGAPNNAVQADCIGNMNANCDPPTVVINVTPESCLGACDGTATATITGGTGPFVLTWSAAPGGGQGTTNATGMCPGIYNLELIDDNGTGCTLNAPATIAAGPVCASCFMTNLTANIGACNTVSGDYQSTGTVEFTDPPTTGQLIIEDCNGNQDVYNAPFTSPVNYTINGQTADGNPCDITAYFTDDLACTINIGYTAPVCVCNLDNFTVNIGACNPFTDEYAVDGIIEFTSPPTTGTLVVEVDNGITVYDTIINLPFTSPQSYSISGIPSDGSNTVITVYFSDNVICSNNINYTAPATCLCEAEAGTYNDNIIGSTNTPYELCFGDQLDITANGDFTPAQDFGLVGVTYDPGIWLALYTCAPTVLPPGDINTDPCFFGIASSNNGAWSIPNNTGDGSTLYYVPITMYSMVDGVYAIAINGGDWCYDMGPVYEVTLLPEITFTFVDDCIAGTATVTVNGGLPELDGSNFTASNLLPATASFSNTTCTDGGTITITGLQGGDMWSFDIIDNDNCPLSVSGGPFPPLEDPGFSYPQNNYCTANAPSNPTITGIAGGTFTSTPAGLTINSSTGQITPATSTPGTYDITYTTPGACFNDSTVTIGIFDVPVANAGSDVSFCPGASVNLNGSGAGTPSWSPTTGLSNPNILNPVANPAVTTTYTLTLNLNGCVGTDDVVVTPLNPTPIAVSPDQSICEGDCATITVSGGDFFIWDPDPEILDSSLTSQTVCPIITTTYSVTSYTLGNDLIVNGDFSAGNTGFTSDYIFTSPTNTAASQYTVTSNPPGFNGAFSPCGDHTTGAGNMLVVNGSTTAGTSVWCQTLSVTPNTDYQFSAWVASVYPVNPAILEFSINGVPIGAPITPSGVTCTWEEFFVTWNSGANTNVDICLVNQNTASSGNDFAIDDITFTTICEQTDQVTITVNPYPSVGAGPDQTICEGDQATLTAINPDAATITWDNGVTDGSAFTPGVGTLTYIVTADLAGCISTDQADITVNPIPVIGAGVDQSICVGDFVTLSGTGGVNYVWDNGVTNGVAFAPAVGTVTYTVTGSDAGGCQNTDQVDVTVNPLDDPTFSYSASTYCVTGTDPSANITGIAGGTFSFVAVSGGPNLSLDPSTGTITLSTSDIGIYDISYNTTGGVGSICPQSSTVQIEITDAPLADFTFGTYCANDIDPMPTLLNGGVAGVFSSSAGLVVNTSTGEVDLSASTPGTYSVNNYVDITGCAIASFDALITINPLPDATISGDTIICPSSTLPDLTFDFVAGSPDWSITYNYNGNSTTVTNISTTPFVISGVPVGTYDLVSVSDNNCSNTLVGQVVIDTFPTPTISVLSNQEVCDGDLMNVQSFNGTPAGNTFDWTADVNLGFGLSGTGDIGSFNGVNGTGSPILSNIIVTPTSNNGCVGPSQNFTITVNPLPEVDFTDMAVGCEPLTAVFTNTTIGTSTNCVWDFGDGTTLNDCGPVSHIYSAGVYDVSLTVTSDLGCTSSTNYSNYVTVSPQPHAHFTYTPLGEITVEDPVVEFTNMSTNADYYDWDFSDNSGVSHDTDPTHEFPGEEPGGYNITLTAYDQLSGCFDTYQAYIVIKDVLIYYVPNIFTPDGDKFNEIFQPIFTSGYDPYDYHLMIFNRWGELLFESYNSAIGWDGTYGTGGLVEDGVYVWVIEFKENMSDNHHTVRGHVTVLK
ncbi:MAG: PKD domain-containing protein [Crocinitomicaceae bacterium]|nr:gliding motility-associated C-terminal domain-containing protein [Crocinitomicaceae bacterium]